MSNLLWICIEEESAVDAFTIIISCLVGKMSFVLISYCFSGLSSICKFS